MLARTAVMTLDGISGTGGKRSVALAVVLALLVALFVPGGSVQASEEGARPLIAYDYSMAGDESRTRILIRFDRKPDFSWFVLRSPYRLVIDLPATGFRFLPDALTPRGMVRDVRYGALQEGRSRAIVSLDGPFEVEKIEAVENDKAPGYRLIVDIVKTTPIKFEQALARMADHTGSIKATPKGDRLVRDERQQERRFTVVIDPGHGGIDGGALGLDGTEEKKITLAFSLELRKKLEETGRYNVFMTRDSDVFLPLDERVRFGRQHDADLFISIHADTIRYRKVRGATVYTISERASDEIAAAIAAHENLADSIAGVELKEENSDVADILVDLVRRETQTYSIRFARSLINELSDDVEMIKNPHRSAGFRVLTAPDMPSVLVELGYLSNPQDEKLMRDPEWRSKAAANIVTAVSLFADAHAQTGG